MGEQYHFDPDTYAELMESEVPSYDRLQDLVAEHCAEIEARTILDLGTGTGVTAGRVVGVQPGATLVGVDESPEMLARARELLPEADLRVGRLEDQLPDGPFDLVVSALAVHHLDGPHKADLFARVARVLAPSGRFVLGDVVIPADPSEVVTPVDDDGHDKPSTVDDQLVWLQQAGFDARAVWVERDLAVIVGDRLAR
jgi:tRNA (cmo5U34)-methyltransferase